MEFTTENAEEKVEEIRDDMRNGTKGTKDYQQRAVLKNLLAVV